MTIEFSYSSNIQEVVGEHPLVESILDEFKQYKNLCVEYGDTPCPPQDIQLAHPAHIETIGRDRLSTHPISARAEDLHHVHIWQEGCSWEDAVNGLEVQWDSTSDSYIVYSYFLTASGNHHFHIIDYCQDAAHELIEDELVVSRWVEQAKQHRVISLGLQ